jgi:nucleoside 2-deoxyribosyltransferase
MKRLFFAAPSADRMVARAYIEALQMMGYQVHDWTKNPGWNNPEGPDFCPEQTAENLFREIELCDGVLWLWTGKPSTGAPLEVGYAFGRGVPVVIVAPNLPDRRNVYPHYFRWADSVKGGLEELKIVIFERREELVFGGSHDHPSF